MADPYTPADHRERALDLLISARGFQLRSEQRLALTLEANVEATLALSAAPAPLAVLTAAPIAEIAEAANAPKRGRRVKAEADAVAEAAAVAVVAEEAAK